MEQALRHIWYVACLFGDRRKGGYPEVLGYASTYGFGPQWISVFLLGCPASQPKGSLVYLRFPVVCSSLNCFPLQNMDAGTASLLDDFPPALNQYPQGFNGCS